MRSKTCIYSAQKEKKYHLRGNYGTVSMFKNIKENLPMLIALHCSSKQQKKELLKHLKRDSIKAICDQEKKKINKSCNKI